MDIVEKILCIAKVEHFSLSRTEFGHKIWSSLLYLLNISFWDKSLDTF